MTFIQRLFSRRRIEADLSEEIRGHLDERIEELVSRGGIPREDAIHQARREFGNVTLIEEQAREVWRWRWIEDSTCFARQLRRSYCLVAGALTGPWDWCEHGGVQRVNAVAPGCSCFLLQTH